ncbi:MAG: hypothetical protein AAGC55_14075, partial [Myxococcota bacterium]
MMQISTCKRGRYGWLAFLGWLFGALGWGCGQPPQNAESEDGIPPVVDAAPDPADAPIDDPPPQDAGTPPDAPDAPDAPEPAVANSAISSVLLPKAPRGLVPVQFVLYDPDSEPVDVRVEYSPDDGEHWFDATIVADTLTTGLASAPDGVAHTITWDTLDLGVRRRPGPRNLLRMTPVDAAGDGLSDTVTVPRPDNSREAAYRVESHMTHYGPLDPVTIAIAEQYPLVVVHPWSGDLLPEEIWDVQDGIDPIDPSDDVLVLCYISIGEDLRTALVSDAEMLGDPRFIGDGSGPRMDPRGPFADGDPLDNIDPRGLPSNGGTGFASFYLDDNSIDQSPDNIGDGLPDRNGIFGGCFVNAGDPAWFEVLDEMRTDSPDALPGMRELLTLDYGRGYGCDGLFLDTVDTAAPNFYTDQNSINQSEYEWTAPGFRDFIARLRDTYPESVILQNRGVFMFDPRLPQYRVTTREDIDFVLFESYRLNSNTFEEFDPYFYPDNRYNVAPKLMAEANRPDGFRVLSLGYAEGPSDAMNINTLVGLSSLGFDSLIEDTRQAHEVGFRHYLTDAGVAFANAFVLQHTELTDTTPPVWSNTYNENLFDWPNPPGPPTPRVGLQELIAAGQALI